MGRGEGESISPEMRQNPGYDQGYPLFFSFKTRFPPQQMREDAPESRLLGINILLGRLMMNKLKNL